MQSLKNGFSKIGAEVLVTDQAQEIEEAHALILPGVGAFGTAMHNLKQYQELIIQHIESGKPFLGICLGLHLLFSQSEETAEVPGLDVFPGKVIRLPPGKKIPHMGWNQLRISKKCPLLDGIGSEYFYFVHSYYVLPQERNIIAAVCDYGIEVPAVLCKDNIFATQFHPEKSGKVGLKILKNFVDFL